MKTQTKTSRILAVLLVLSLLMLVFVGCASSGDTEGGDAAKGGSKAYQQYMDWLKQYEKWADSYVAICKNYNKNPVTYMSDYVAKTAELAEWTAKFDDIDDDDLTTVEVAKITSEYLKIYNKMMKALSEIE